MGVSWQVSVVGVTSSLATHSAGTSSGKGLGMVVLNVVAESNGSEDRQVDPDVAFKGMFSLLLVLP